MAEKYGSFIASELSDAISGSQEASRRALTVVSTAGGFVTLISAAIGVAAVNRKDAFFPDSARSPLSYALVWFIIAAIIALLTQLPLLVTDANVDSLSDLVANSWNDSATEAGKQVAEAQIDMLRTQRKMNTVRSWLLIFAITAEMIAVVYMGLVGNRVVQSLARTPTAQAPIRNTTSTTSAP